MVMAPRPMRETSRLPRCAFFIRFVLPWSRRFLGSWRSGREVARPTQVVVGRREQVGSASTTPIATRPRATEKVTADGVPDSPPRPGRIPPSLGGVDNRAEVKAFLVSRRAKVTPEQAGLSAFNRTRRVPGLRRSEVADLAGVSVEYYAQLERGNLAGVSESVLDALSRALRLDDAERAHLLHLAAAAGPGRRTRRKAPAQQVRASVQRLIDLMDAVPVIVNNARLETVATNTLGRALFAPVWTSPTAFLTRTSQPRPVHVPRPTRPGLLGRLGTRRRRRRRPAAHRGRPRPLRQGPHGPRRRAQHPQRTLPATVGRPRRPPAPDRDQAAPPPGRRRPGAQLRSHGAPGRHRPHPHRLHRSRRDVGRRRPHPPRQLGKGRQPTEGSGNARVRDRHHPDVSRGTGQQLSAGLKWEGRRFDPAPRPPPPQAPPQVRPPFGPSWAGASPADVVGHEFVTVWSRMPRVRRPSHGKRARVPR